MRVRVMLLVGVLAITMTGCSYFNTKSNTKVDNSNGETENVKDLNNIEQQPSESSTIRSLDEVGADNLITENNVTEDTGIIDEVQETKTIVLEDGTEMTVSVEAAEAISEYEKLNDKITESKYPQEKEVKINVESAYETTVESSFNIKEIVYQSTKYSEKAQAVLYANVSGVIAGLDGGYEIQLPYEKAIKLKSGDTFAITYQTIRLNERVVITNINY